MRPTVARVQGGMKMLLAQSGDVVQQYLWWFGLWEPELSDVFVSTLQAGDICVDVGANVGYFTLLAARLVGEEGTVYAFEPGPTAHHLLKLNVNLNLNSIRVPVLSRSAVSDKAGEITLIEPDNGELALLGAHSIGTAFQAKTVRLDDDIDTTHFHRCRILKIDVEGAELAVLLGASRLLGAAPNILVCCEVGPSDGQRVFDLMHDMGFIAFQIKNEYDPRAHARRARAVLTQIDTHPGSQVDVVFARGRPMWA